MIPITSVPTGQYILLCWAIFLVYWFVESFRVKQTVESRPVIGKDLLVGIVIFLGCLLLLRLLSPQLLGMTLWQYSLYTGVLADVMVTLGLALLIWSRVHLGRNWSAGLVLKEQHELVQTGPYAFIRHPIYTGLFLMLFGEAVWYGMVMWFVFFTAVCVGMVIKARREELLMLEHFPTIYPAYKKRTKAFIPFIV